MVAPVAVAVAAPVVAPVAVAASMADLRAGFPALFDAMDNRSIKSLKSVVARDRACMVNFVKYALMSAHSGIGVNDKAMLDMIFMVDRTKEGKPSKATKKWQYATEVALNNPRGLAGQGISAYKGYALEVEGVLEALIFPAPAPAPAEAPAPAPVAPAPAATFEVVLASLAGFTAGQLQQLAAAIQQQQATLAQEPALF